MASNSQMGSEFRTFANGAGVWVLSAVPCGSYTVTVTAQGFRNAMFKHIKVDAGSAAKVDATLQIGLSDLVVVTASKYEEEVVNAPATASVISEQAIRELPSQNLADLLRVVPGVNVAQSSVRQFGAPVAVPAD